MAIAGMLRLYLLAPESQRQTLMDALLQLGCVEISPAPDQSPPWPQLRPTPEELSTLQEERLLLREALDLLKRAAPQKTSLLSSRPTVTEAELLSCEALSRGLNIARRACAHGAAIARLKARAEQLKKRQQLLLPWQDWSLPAKETVSSCLRLSPGTLPLRTDREALRAALAEAVPEAELYALFRTPERQGLVLVSHREVTDRALELLRGWGFSPADWTAEDGTPARQLRHIRREAEQTARQLRQEEASLLALGPQQRELRLCLDRVDLQLRLRQARQQLLSDGCVLYLSGWVPERQAPRLTRLLARYGCAFQLRRPTPEEVPDVPVKLENGPIARCMNCITGQYALPVYDGIDPNPLMAPFFILFFGLMMADMAYGLLMLAGSRLVLRRRRPADPSFWEMLFWCGLSSLLFGALTGSFLGDFLPQLFRLIRPGSRFALPALFSPLNDPMAVMLGSLALGGIQILTGMAVSVVKKCREGRFPDALWDEITWWVLLAGGGLALGGVGSVAGLPAPLLPGLLMLLYGSGRGRRGFGRLIGLLSAVYNGVTGFFSDILSYVRLMALMLSGAVLAQVFNMLGATTGNVIGFVLIALVGNALNLALNLLGCYVHDMRLQFLEFFGRFYKEGGRAYRPLSVQANYAEIIKEEQDNV